jgi:hypothetical protein
MPVEIRRPLTLTARLRDFTQIPDAPQRRVEALDLKIELADLLKKEANRIVFTRGRGDGNLYYTAYLTASLHVDEIEPLDQGMNLMREPRAFNLHTSRHIMRLMGRSDDKWRKYLFY